MKTKLLLLTLISISAPQFVYSAGSCRTIYGPRATTKATDLYFKEKVGQVEEHSLRQNQTVAHLYMDSSKDPYFFVAFPAGNSGVAVWMKSATGRAKLEATTAPLALQRDGGLNGMEISIRSGTQTLQIDDSVLGSMRFIRDRELGMNIPPEVSTRDIKLENGKLILDRASLNGLARYVLEIEPIGDTKVIQNGGSFELTSNGEAQFKIRGLTSETPLTPLAPSEVFTASALKKMKPKQLQAFSFLLYKEKLMAGSPRYLSKFGRDSIYTLRVLMDIMKPEAIENLLTATISSMHPTTGLVSHEQNEGDFTSYVRLKRHEKYKGVNRPMEDYKMVDDDFAFTIVLSEYMKRYPERAKEFLQRNEQRGYVQKDLVLNLFKYVSKATADFAANPIPQNLIGLKGHEKTGQWRDSENGLAGGKYPFDVNAAFVPAALKALADLCADSASEFYNPNRAAELSRSFDVWNTRVMPLFQVRIPADQVAVRGASYLRSIGIDPQQLPAAPQGDIVFPAIALDANGKPIPVMHSDDSLMMTFGHPSEAYLKTVSQRVKVQFPYGLGTPVGILVANPVFASRELQQQFDETKYHGRVSWAMQEDLLIYGIRRQLHRPDISNSVKEELLSSEAEIEKTVAAKSSMGGTEVFSILFRNGRYEAVPFDGDAKSNSNQLWSHLRLAF